MTFGSLLSNIQFCRHIVIQQYIHIKSQSISLFFDAHHCHCLQQPFIPHLFFEFVQNFDYLGLFLLVSFLEAADDIEIIEFGHFDESGIWIFQILCTVAHEIYEIFSRLQHLSVLFEKDVQHAFKSTGQFILLQEFSGHFLPTFKRFFQLLCCIEWLPLTVVDHRQLSIDASQS